MELMPGFKQTEVGVIPAEWTITTLGEMGDVLIGLTYRPDDVRKHGTLVLRSSNIQEGSLRFDDNVCVEAEIPERLMVRPGDVLICVRNGSRDLIGKSVLLDERTLGMTFGAFMGVFRSPAGKFVSYLFQSDILKRQINEHLGATINQITNKSLNSFQIPLPPTQNEQSAIAAALGDVDALLGGLNQLIAKKRDLKQAVMQQLLTGKTRLPGFQGEWQVKRLGELGAFLKGSGVKKDEARSGQLACIRYGEIYTHHDNYIKSFNSWISREVADRATPLRHGDILFAGSGETKEEIGKCVAFVDDVEAYAGGDIVILRPSGVDSLFLGYLLNTPPIASQKASQGQGDAVVHISSNALARINLSLPSLDEQTAIAAVLSDMDAELSILEARRYKTHNLKEAVMQDLLTGRTRLVQPVLKLEKGSSAQVGKQPANIHFKRSVLAAEIIDRLHEEPTFGHVKFEKMIFLVEHLCDVDTGSSYHRDAAGPYDNRAIRSIDSQLSKRKWFEVQKSERRYRYVPMASRGGHEKYFDRYFGEIRPKLDEILNTFRTFDTTRCEIVATLFGAWNDLISEGKDISDAVILHEVLNNWHDSKRQIPEERWLKALAWMRKKGFTPAQSRERASDCPTKR